jgi:hypothetical protein
MRWAATLVPFTLVAVAFVSAQTPAGTSNNPSNTQQTQAVPNKGIAPNTPAPGTTSVIDQVGAGTEMHAALDTPLSTRTSKAGDRFTATISDPVRASNGADVIPAGTRVEGEVAEVEEGKTVSALRGKEGLSLRFRDVVLPNGQTLPLTATLVSVHDTGGKNPRKTAAEGPVPSTMRGKDATQGVGIGAGIGTAGGLVFGGPIKGLAIGALAGGGYILSVKGKDVNLPAQTGMVIRLDQSLSWNGTSTPQQR